MNPILIFLITLGLGLYLYQAKKRNWRRLSLTRSARRLTNDRDGVRIIKQLGAGNIGVVYLAELSGEWRKQLGIQWSCSRIPEEPVALKICSFKDERKRLHVLVRLAGVIDQALDAGSTLSLCPLLAVGLIEGTKPGEHLITEIMPHIRGDSLKNCIRDKKSLGTNPQIIMPKLLRILETAVFLEEKGFYTRSLDLENVIVQNDGSWLRIDYDSASKEDKSRAKRIRRLCRFSSQVLKSTGSDAPDIIDAIRKIKDTLRSLDRPAGRKHGDIPIQNTEDLIRIIENLKP